MYILAPKMYKLAAKMYKLAPEMYILVPKMDKSLPFEKVQPQWQLLYLFFWGCNHNIFLFCQINLNNLFSSDNI